MSTYQPKYLQLNPPGYYKALDDLGVIELLQKLAHATESQCDLEEIESLAALLIKHLANCLNLNWVNSYLNGVRNGQGEMISQMLSRSQQMPLPADSPSFFLDASVPRFPFATAVRWTLLEEPELTDWGIIIGRFYGYAPESGHWMWCYLVLLDPGSPSSRWCVVDTAWEVDLERLEDE
jgi:hypothetical protein